MKFTLLYTCALLSATYVNAALKHDSTEVNSNTLSVDTNKNSQEVHEFAFMDDDFEGTRVRALLTDLGEPLIVIGVVSEDSSSQDSDSSASHDSDTDTHEDTDDKDDVDADLGRRLSISSQEDTHENDASSVGASNSDESSNGESSSSSDGLANSVQCVIFKGMFETTNTDECNDDNAVANASYAFTDFALTISDETHFVFTGVVGDSEGDIEMSFSLQEGSEVMSVSEDGELYGVFGTFKVNNYDFKNANAKLAIRVFGTECSSDYSLEEGSVGRIYQSSQNNDEESIDAANNNDDTDSKSTTDAVENDDDDDETTMSVGTRRLSETEDDDDNTTDEVDDGDDHDDEDNDNDDDEDNDDDDDTAEASASNGSSNGDDSSGDSSGDDSENSSSDVSAYIDSQDGDEYHFSEAMFTISSDGLKLCGDDSSSTVDIGMCINEENKELLVLIENFDGCDLVANAFVSTDSALSYEHSSGDNDDDDDEDDGVARIVAHFTVAMFLLVAIIYM